MILWLKDKIVWSNIPGSGSAVPLQPFSSWATFILEPLPPMIRLATLNLFWPQGLASPGQFNPAVLPLCQLCSRCKPHSLNLNLWKPRLKGPCARCERQIISLKPCAQKHHVRLHEIRLPKGNQRNMLQHYSKPHSVTVLRSRLPAKHTRCKIA